jgi:DNA-binding response OmpR family regulator
MTATPFNPRVLIADDDPAMLLMHEHALEGLGRSFDAVENGSDAWTAWERERHPLVLLDVVMPGLDGLEVCRRIRVADPERNTFVVIVTGRDRAADLEEVLDAGADDYVRKPVTGPSLVARLRIAQRRMMDNAARRVAEEELRRARYMAGIGEATVAIQHEINNPLAALMATAELMLMEQKKLGLSTQELKAILEEGHRISALVKRMGNLRDPKAVQYVGDAKMIDLRDTK